MQKKNVLACQCEPSLRNWCQITAECGTDLALMCYTEQMTDHTDPCHLPELIQIHTRVKWLQRHGHFLDIVIHIHTFSILEYSPRTRLNLRHIHP